jgi:NitT/TauT family transport system permease protein
LQLLLPVVISLIAGLTLWQMAVMFLDIPSYVLPRPTAVWLALVDGLTRNPFSQASYLYHLWDTLLSTVYGFLIGCVLGMILASAMSESRLVERALLPYVVGLQSLPKVAIAPLYMIWFGYGMESKVAMAATLTLFPMLINSLQGLMLIERERIELMISVKATRWQMFRFVKFPSALPMIFAGLNLAIVYALLGTIVAEFIGAQRGMGVVITQLQSVSDTAGVFATLAILAVIGYVLIAVMRAFQRRVVFWAKPTSPGSLA